MTNQFVSLQYNERDINELIASLIDMYPLYFQELRRIIEIIETFDVSDNDYITFIIEEDYVDKQYRDSYYTYFSQKYSNFPKNCLRLSVFRGIVRPEDFMGDISGLEKDCFIGFVVLRPLYVGNIGKTILNPKYIKTKGYVQTCKHKTMICGRKMTIRAFPFMAQDDETMTCAETALFDLIQYYGQKYSEYRTLMPSEILGLVEKSTYQRVLPSIGVDDRGIAKVLQAAHLHPRAYHYVEQNNRFDTIIHAYVESGIPFILGLPHHAVICIGHGKVDLQGIYHELDDITDGYIVEGEKFYLLSTARLIDQYIFMDDNKVPYYLSTIDELTEEYYNNSQEESFIDDEDAEPGDEDLEDSLQAIGDDKVEVHYNNATLRIIKDSYLSAIVPLSRRIFLDADRAWSIFEDQFLLNPDFVAEIAKAYDDQSWGKDKTNPLVWRMFLASSNSYKDFKSRTADNQSMFDYYSSQPYPRFIWVLEIGTLSTFAEQKARVEILLDATSSCHSNFWAILSIRYNNHLVYVPAVINKKDSLLMQRSNTKDHGELKRNDDDIKLEALDEKVRNNVLQKVFNALYNNAKNFVPATYSIFRDSNLKEI